MEDTQGLVIEAGMYWVNYIERVRRTCWHFEGQSGLALAAQLKALNVKDMIVDKLPRMGNSWRYRYKVSLSSQLASLNPEWLESS